MRLIDLSQPLSPEFGRNLEELMVFKARVSNPSNQQNHDTADKLLRFCVMHGHWSVLEMASATIEIETTRATSAQLTRHRSFTFQERSQRYAPTTGVDKPVLFAANPNGNRQGSGDQLPDDHWAYIEATKHVDQGMALYQDMIDASISCESAREILPMNAWTTVYMHGTIRSWFHFCQVRSTPDAQWRVRKVAGWVIDNLFKEHCPTLYMFLRDEGWLPLEWVPKGKKVLVKYADYPDDIDIAMFDGHNWEICGGEALTPTAWKPLP
jgi:thymidylate synthase (FAD)